MRAVRIQYKHGNGDTATINVNDRNQADISALKVAMRRIHGPACDQFVLHPDDRAGGEITLYDGQVAAMIIA